MGEKNEGNVAQHVDFINYNQSYCISLPRQAEAQQRGQHAEDGSDALVEAVPAPAEVVVRDEAVEEVAQHYGGLLGAVFLLGLEQLVAVEPEPADALQEIAIRHALPQHWQSFPAAESAHLNQVGEHVAAVLQHQQGAKSHHEPIQPTHLFLLHCLRIIPQHQAEAVDPQQPA